LPAKNLQQWAGVDLNHRHTDFQSVALPTELPARKGQIPIIQNLNLAEKNDFARKLGYTFVCITEKGKHYVQKTLSIILSCFAATRFR
jgi:hypothetical protein